VRCAVPLFVCLGMDVDVARLGEEECPATLR
jgi:hypothetical protein